MGEESGPWKRQGFHKAVLLRRIAPPSFSVCFYFLENADQVSCLLFCPSYSNLEERITLSESYFPFCEVAMRDCHSGWLETKGEEVEKVRGTEAVCRKNWAFVRSWRYHSHCLVVCQDLPWASPTPHSHSVKQTSSFSDEETQSQRDSRDS